VPAGRRSQEMSTLWTVPAMSFRSVVLLKSREFFY